MPEMPRMHDWRPASEATRDALAYAGITATHECTNCMATTSTARAYPCPGTPCRGRGHR